MYHTGSFIRGRSLVHRLDPRVKLSAALVFSIFILWVKPSLALASGVILLFPVLISDISLRTLVQAIKPLLFLIVLIFMVHVFFSDGSGEAPGGQTFHGLSFSRTGFQEAFWVVWRFLCLMVAAILLTMTTAPSQMIAAVKYFLKPLKKVRVPVDELAVMLLLALKLMPILLTEKERIETAQKSRGYDASRSGWVTRLKSFSHLTSKILTGVFRRADELALAMDARNFRRGERSSLAELKLTSSDYIVMGLLIFFLIIFVALNSHFG